MSYWNRFLGLLPNNRTRSLRADAQSNLAVAIAGTAISIYGDLATAEMDPLFQFDWVTQPVTAGTMTQLGGAYVTNGGTSGTSTGRLRLATSVNPLGSSAFISNQSARSYGGQGSTVRFSGVFPNGGVVTSTQVLGVCSPAITWTGAPAAPGQPITAVGVGDGYFFGYDNTSFGIRHKNSRTATDVWTPQASWNVDTCDGSGSAANPSSYNLNPTLGNVYQIRYPYLGYGDIQFWIMDQASGLMILVHVIQYTNTTQETEVNNPAMNFFAQVIKTAGATDIVIFSGSIGAFLNGERKFNGPQFGWDARLTNIANGTETPVFSLRNATRVNGAENRRLVRLRSASFSNNGAATESRFRIRRNSALTGATFANAVFGTITGGSAGYILTAAQSAISVDTAATAIAAFAAGASDVVFNAVSGQNQGYQIDLTPFSLILVPGDTLTMTMLGYAGTTNVQVAVNWNEDT